MDKKIVLENVINACAEGNQAQFARRLGESPQTINAWLRRGTLDPIKIYKTFTCLNPHWLLTGEGEMMKEETAEHGIVVGCKSRRMNKTERIECIINALCDGNKSRFAKLLDVKPQTVSTWLTRDTFDIERVYSCCGALNPHWLLTGEGEMMKDEATKAEPADTAALRARLEAAESLVEALRAQLEEKEQTAAVLRQLVAEKQKLINLLEAR